MTTQTEATRSGLIAIKSLLSRDPCVHANVAIEMIDAMLAEQPAPAQEPVAWMITTEMQDGRPTTYPVIGRYKDVKDMCDFGEPVPLVYGCTTPQPPAQPLENERELFAAFVKKNLGDIAVMDGGRYISPKINNYWLVWQEARGITKGNT